MFRKLRNKLILINLSVTTAVIVVVFAAVYIISTRSAEGRPPVEVSVSFNDSMSETDTEIFVPPHLQSESDEMREFLHQSLDAERKAAAQNLLILLIVAGIAIEIAVAVVSYFMAEEAIKPVREAYDAQKIFIANASHEIKTPLAAIAANLEAADVQDNHFIKNVEMETARLTKLNNELLTLARTDIVAPRKVEETNLAEVVSDAIKNHAPRLGERKLTKKIAFHGKTKINKEDFEQLVNILLDNAIKYSKTKIMVMLNNHDFTITNDGAKISKDALPHIFERFYQADKTADGVGLGLSIAKSIADRNHWKLEVKSDKDTTFMLHF